MNTMETTKHEIQQIQTRILELLRELPGKQIVENEEYRQLRERLTELQNLVRQYEVERVFGYYSYPIQYCRCPLPEIHAGNRQHPARCLCCGRAIHPARVSDKPEEEFNYKREVMTALCFVLAVALCVYLCLTGGFLP